MGKTKYGFITTLSFMSLQTLDASTTATARRIATRTIAT